jgi:tRNA (Thr-GGU) A37 N-methylase
MNEVPLTPIGHVQSSTFKSKWGTPRQGGIAPTSEARVVLVETLTLGMLVPNTRVAVLWIANLNGDKHNPLKARIKPPKLATGTVGVFATRGVHRPSPLGLTFCTVQEIRDSMISLRGADMVEGTPILQIIPEVTLHGLDSLRHVRSPPWIQSRTVTVLWTLGSFLQTLRFDEVTRAMIVSTLSHDPRSHHSIRKHNDPIYEVSMGTPDGGTVWVIYQHIGADIRILFVSHQRVITDARGRTEEWLSSLRTRFPFFD